MNRLRQDSETINQASSSKQNVNLLVSWCNEAETSSQCTQSSRVSMTHLQICLGHRVDILHGAAHSHRGFQGLGDCAARWQGEPPDLLAPLCVAEGPPAQPAQ